MLDKRDPNLWVFGSWFGSRFADNPKYLYLYCVKTGINSVWITKNTEIYNDLRRQGLPVALEESKEGIEACKKAKYAVYCTYLSDISEEYLGNATLINLWHGIPLKKIMWDDTITRKNDGDDSLKAKVGRLMRRLPDRNTYVFSTSPAFTKIYQSAFRVDRSRIIEIGQVRNDCFFDGSLTKKSYSDIPYKYLISYLPTHRNEGKTKLEDNELFDLQELESFCKKNDALFLIKKHYYHKNEFTDLSLYPHIIDVTTDNNIDTQQLMFDTDILITDYSSCYIDYLLLDRPIVFYCFDYDKYLATDREMYFSYDAVTPGVHARTFNELISGIDQALSGNEKYKNKQKNIKNFFYSKENQGIVAPRLIDAIKRI